MAVSSVAVNVFAVENFSTQNISDRFPRSLHSLAMVIKNIPQVFVGGTAELGETLAFSKKSVSMGNKGVKGGEGIKGIKEGYNRFISDLAGGMEVLSDGAGNIPTVISGGSQELKESLVIAQNDASISHNKKLSSFKNLLKIKNYKLKIASNDKAVLGVSTTKSEQSEKSFFKKIGHYFSRKWYDLIGGLWVARDIRMDDGSGGIISIMAPKKSGIEVSFPENSGTLITDKDIGTVTNAMLQGSITADKLLLSDITKVGTITSGEWQGTPIAWVKVNKAGSSLGDLETVSASDISSGTINNSRLTADVTLQGNTFNNPGQLVQISLFGELPVVSGANLTNLNGSQIASGIVNPLYGGTGLGSYSVGDLLYATSTTQLSRLAISPTAGLCLRVSAGGIPTWENCTAGIALTMQGIYDQGNTVTTTNSRDVSYTLADTATDSNFLVNIATGSTGKFSIQGNGVDIFSVLSSGVFIYSGGLSVQGGINNNSGGITNAGAISGATTIDASDTVTLSKTDGVALNVAGNPQASATASLLQMGSAIVGGSASGTYIGLNAPNLYDGSLMDLQIGDISVFKVVPISYASTTYNGAELQIKAGGYGAPRIKIRAYSTSPGGIYLGGGGDAHKAIDISYSSGGVIRMGASGGIKIGSYSDPTAKMDILTGTTSKIGLIIQGSVGQTANLQEWRDSAGAVLASISAGGNLTVSGTANSLGTITSGTWNGTAVGVPYGGTGLTSLAQNGLLYGNAGSAVGVTAEGATGQVLIGTTGAAPSWSNSPTLSGTLSVGTIITGAATDLLLQPTTGVLALNTTGTQNILRIYDSTNTKYAQITHNGTDTVISSSSGAVQLGSGAGDVTLGSGVNLLVTGTPPVSATASLLRMGDAIQGGSVNGTFYGLNATAGYSGNLADWQVNNVSKFLVDASGNTTIGGNLNVSGAANALGTITSGTWNGTAVDVPHGGTGLTSLSQNGLLYGNAGSNVGVTAEGATGQVLIGTTGSAPSWTNSPTLSGTLSVGTIITGAATDLLLQPTTGILALNTTGVQNILRIYDSTNTKYAQITHDGTDTVISSSSGDVAIGSGGDVSLDSGVNLLLDGAPPVSATASLIQMTNPIAGGSANGTYLGINASAGFAGNFIDYQVNSISQLKVTSGGAVTQAGALTISSGGINNTSGGITNAGAISGATTVVASGTISTTAASAAFTANSATATAFQATAAPAASATSSIIQLGAAIVGGSASGTYIGINASAGYAGNFVDYQVNGSSVYKITASGGVTMGGTLTVSTIASTGALAISSATNNNINLTVSGTGKVTLGDGGVTNYAQFDANGALTFAGAARPYSEIVLIPDDAVIPAANGCPRNQTDATNFSYFTVDCDPDADEWANWQFKMPQNYVNASNIQVDIYWEANDTSGAAKFNAGYVAVANGEAFDAASRTDVAGTASATAGTAYYLNTTTMTLTTPSIEADDMVTLRILRDADDGTDTLAVDAKIIKVRVKFLVGS